MTYEIDVVGEEVEFEPIEATDIHDAARKVRELLANSSVWTGGVETFTATVIIHASDGSATIKMPVSCAVGPRMTLAETLKANGSSVESIFHSAPGIAAETLNSSCVHIGQLGGSDLYRIYDDDGDEPEVWMVEYSCGETFLYYGDDELPKEFVQLAKKHAA
jgi:hypothetical protein